MKNVFICLAKCLPKSAFGRAVILPVICLFLICYEMGNNIWVTTSVKVIVPARHGQTRYVGPAWFERENRLEELDDADPDDPNVQRRVRVRDVCRRHDIHPDPVGLKLFLTHAMVDDRRKVIYCFIPKAGSTSWKALFVKLSGVRTPSMEEDEFRKYHLHGVLNRAKLTRLKGLSPERIQHKLKNYFKFMVVRHPLDRLASAFHDKFRYDYNYTVPLREELSQHIIKKYGSGSRSLHPDGKVNFEEFVEFILSQEKAAVNEHWLSYQRLCQPCRVDYDYIGTTETSQEDVPRILERMRLQEHSDDFQSIHKTKHSDALYRGFYRNLSTETQQRLVKRYAADLDMFGYSWQDYFRRKTTESTTGNWE